MLAKDKEDFVDTICSMSDSNGGGGDTSDVIRYYKVKDGVIKANEFSEMFFIFLAPLINISCIYEVNAGRDLSPKVTNYIYVEQQESTLDIYLKCLADMYVKDKNKEGFYIERLLNEQGLTFEGLGLVPCTKEEFYDISWSPDDFQ